MRNKYKGTCYLCGKTVEVGAGHFEREIGKGWRTIHANCVFRQREEKAQSKSSNTMNSFEYGVNHQCHI